MTALGRYPQEPDGPNGILDRGLPDAIRRYQADHGLKQDGWLAPGGETALAIGRDLVQAANAAPAVDNKQPDSLSNPKPLDPVIVHKSQQKMNDYLEMFRQNAARDRASGIDQGWQLAHDHLQHYLNNTGTPVELTSQQLAQMPAVMNAEQENRLKFEETTFTGTTGNPDLNNLLRNIHQGKPVTFSDHWDRRTNALDNRPADYAAIGKSSVHSQGTFTALRQGDEVTIQGDVTHLLGGDPDHRHYYRDRYDFEAGQPGSFPATVLESAGQAKQFDMTSAPRRQKVSARVRIERGGRLSVVKDSIKWGAVR